MATTTTVTRPTSPNVARSAAGSATDIMDSLSVGGTASGTLVDAPVYPHTSTFESDNMSITLSSPHLELTFPNGNDGAIVKLPVFSAKDSIGGTVSINPASYPNSPSAKIVVSLEGAFYWSEPRPAEFTTLSRRRNRESASVATLSGNVERKHVFLYSSLNLPLSDEEAPTNTSSPFDAILLNRQQALAAVRRRMSYGRAEASRLIERARRKKSVGNVEELGASNTILSRLSTRHESPPGTGTSFEMPESMVTADPWIQKTFMFQLPLQQSEGKAALLPPSVDLRAEALEHEKGKTKLVEDVRIQYKLVARYESPLLSLSKQLEVPIIFEPGSNLDSYYAVPQKPIRWREHPMDLVNKPSDGSPVTFKPILTLPNPPVFARDSDAAFFVAYATSPPDDGLIARIRDQARITMTISCTYRFDPRRAAAHTSRANDNSAAYNGKEETIWKWQDPPPSPLKKRVSLRKERSDTVGSRKTTIKRLTGDSSTIKIPASESATEVGTLNEHKALPALPPSSPESESGARISTEFGGIGGRISTPLPLDGFKDDHEGERTIVLLNTDRIGFPHRAKVKEGQVTPQGLWKGKLNWQWWMMPSLDMAGLTVKYRMEVGVELDGIEFRIKKEFRIVEPHTVRKEERIPQTKKVEVDAIV